MSRELTPQSSLAAMRTEARRWLKALKSGEPQAVARFERAHPAPGKKPTLRLVQHALAREHGLASWAALKQALDERSQSHAERVRLFLEKSAIRYGVAPGTSDWPSYEPDRPARGERAARLLERHPEIARESIHTAVAAGDADAVRGFLAANPAQSRQRGGPDGWTPLLRLAYTRLPVAAAAENAETVAQLLLEHGASVQSAWSDGTNEFNVLTGVIGGGEAGQSAHPRAEVLARLLLAHGADPLDRQALYNTSLGADDPFWLQLLWAETERRGQTQRWREPGPSIAGPPLDFLLGQAVPGQPRRAAWLLEHGARADAKNAYSKQPVIRAALLHGDEALVQLLERHGARRPKLSDRETFLAAAMRGDAQTLRELATRHPSFSQDASALFAVMRDDRADVARLLLDLGLSPDAGDHQDFRVLHYTTHCGALETAKLLIARGAEVDAIEHRYGSTPLGHAVYQDRPEMIALIAAHSRDVRGLCQSGSVERLAALLGEDASLASQASRGEPPLFALPDNDERAVEIAELLLAHGADASVRDADGLTPEEAARKRGLDDAADVLGAHVEM